MIAELMAQSSATCESSSMENGADGLHSMKLCNCTWSASTSLHTCHYHVFALLPFTPLQMLLLKK